MTGPPVGGVVSRARFRGSGLGFGFKVQALGCKVCLKVGRGDLSNDPIFSSSLPLVAQEYPFPFSSCGFLFKVEKGTPLLSSGYWGTYCSTNVSYYASQSRVQDQRLLSATAEKPTISGSWGLPTVGVTFLGDPYDLKP